MNASCPPAPRRRWLLSVGAAAVLAGLGLLVGALLPDGAQADAALVGLEVAVTAMDRSVAPANNSPVLVADPGDRQFVALANRLDAPDFSCALHVSGDAGRSWAPVVPVRVLPEGAEKCYAPEVAFDRDGRLYYLFVGLAGRGNEPMGAFLTSSDDRGRTFSPPRRVLGPLSFAVRMAIDPDLGQAGRMHLVWIAVTADPPLGGFPAPPNPIMSAYSDDGGESFTAPVQVSDAQRDRVVAPALALGPDHSVHVGYYDLGRDAVDYQGLEGPVWQQPWSVLLASSTDGGERFGEAVVVEDAVVPYERVLLIFTMTPPALAVHGEQVCAAWADGRSGDADVLARCSDDGGRRWNEATRINDDPLGNGLSQFTPQLDFSPQGRLDAVFHDRRGHPSNGLNYTYLTFSSDGGRSWAPNVQLSRHASSSLVGQRYANPSAMGRAEFGSRLGLLSGPDSALAAWGDTRNSRPDSTGQDVFTAIVALPASGPSWPVPVGVGLVGAGVLGLAASLLGRRTAGNRPGVTP